MDRSDAPVVLIVRGAGASGRRLTRELRAHGAVAIVLDERTCAHEGVDSVRVPLTDVAKARQAVGDVLHRYGRVDAIVLLPSPTWTTGASDGSTWEFHLQREVANVAGIVRTASPALAERRGMVLQVSAPSQPREPSHPASLLGAVCAPVLDALAREYGFRFAPVVTDEVGTARGALVGETLVAHLALQRRREVPAAPRAAESA